MSSNTLPSAFYSHAPVLYVVVEVRISPVMTMEKYIPEVQDRLRRTGFPGLAEQNLREIEFKPPDNIVLNDQKSWDFLSQDGTRGISITTNAISVSTTNHTGYVHLEADLRLVLGVAKEVIEVTTVQRLGLRYINLIRKGDDPDFGRLFHSGLHGLTDTELGLASSLFNWVITGTNAQGTLRIRGEQVKGRILPGDLRPTSLRLPDAPPNDETVLLLDIDHFSPMNDAFDPEEIVARMSGLHSGAYSAFCGVTTPHARKLWNTKESMQ